jgi:hypothetical protein
MGGYSELIDESYGSKHRLRWPETSCKSPLLGRVRSRLNHRNDVHFGSNASEYRFRSYRNHDAIHR